MILQQCVSADDMKIEFSDYLPLLSKHLDDVLDLKGGCQLCKSLLRNPRLGCSVSGTNLAYKLKQKTDVGPNIIFKTTVK